VSCPTSNASQIPPPRCPPHSALLPPRPVQDNSVFSSLPPLFLFFFSSSQPRQVPFQLYFQLYFQLPPTTQSPQPPQSPHPRHVFRPR
jgi:hypothetical protein